MKNIMKSGNRLNMAVRIASIIVPLFLATACTQVEVPDGRSVNVPTVTPPADRYKGLNEKRDPITRVKLGHDVLVPQPLHEDPMPDDIVGPFELRGETLASALQLILDDYDVSLAFESDLAMTTKITVANLRGKVGDVVDRACELANLYCHYEKGTLTVKETETFVVDMPPLAVTATGVTANGPTASYNDIVQGLTAIIGTTPTIDPTTRVMIYTATQRAHKYAQQYFERLRKNTALIIYETHIWEVSLNNSNRTGIDWEGLFNNVGNFNLDLKLPGGAPSATGSASPISITPTYTGSGDITSSMVLEFISERGTVKTVSQPQLTVLSGSSANLAVEQSENFVSGITRTPSTTAGVADSVSTTTETVQTGLTMNVSSAWDQSTVYGVVSIELNELLGIDEFEPDDNTKIQLPQTTARNIATQIRVRPGDAVLIAGLVTEKDNYSASGPGFLNPLIQTTRSAGTKNTELVFLLRPRIVIFDNGSNEDTPAIVNAPTDKVKPPTGDVTGDVGAMFGSSMDKKEEVLPATVSPAAMIPVSPEPVVMPADMKGEQPAYQPEQLPPEPQPQPAVDATATTNEEPVKLVVPQEPKMPEQAPVPAATPEQEQQKLNTNNASGLPSWLPSQSAAPSQSGGTTP